MNVPIEPKFPWRVLDKDGDDHGMAYHYATREQAEARALLLDHEQPHGAPHAVAVLTFVCLPSGLPQ